MQRFPYIPVMVLFLIISCFPEQNKARKKQRVLKKEFKEIYKHNKQKKQAANFLIKELNNKFTIKGKRCDIYAKNIIELKDDVDSLESILNKIKGAYSQNIVAEDDLSNVDAAYLQANIDQSYAALEKAAWKDNISFKDFCNYILPHRLKHEPLENWRKEVFEDYGDSAFLYTDIEKATLYLAKKISKYKKDLVIRFGDANPNIPDVPYSILKILPIGSCKEITDYTSFILRSYAIPCVKDFTPNYSNLNSGHDWNAVITSPGKIIPFILPLEVDTLGRFKTEHYKLAKVYRNIYEKKSESHFMKRGFCEFLPKVFNDPFIKDVTHQYVQTADISINSEFNRKEKFAYLSVFNGINWIPIAWGTRKRKQYEFDNVGVGSVFLPQTIEKDNTNNINYPVVVKEDGSLQFLKPDSGKTISLKILRKYPLTGRIRYYINRMTGGAFQAANSPDFSDAVTLYKIEESVGEYFNTIQVDPESKKYRYIRFLSPEDSYCNVAELEFYAKNDTLNNLNGKIIATEGINKEFPNRTKEKSFDGDVLTFFHAVRPDSCWIGMDFGKPIDIGTIRFIARTDYNTIVKGNLYEVFYWDNKWVSLGKKEADSHVLTYDDVPSNALYFIKNHTAGKEERIFTYENGEQVWW